MSNHLGIYRGVVVDNNDPLNKGRVKCKVPQVLADQHTHWCEPIYPTVYKPKVDEIVWVLFVNGDLTKPIYLSSDAVTAEKIVAGTILFDNLAGSAVSTIVANSVAAAKVSIGDQTNRVGDPFFDGVEAWKAQGAPLSFLTSSSPGVPAGSPKPSLASLSLTTTNVSEVSNDTNATPHTFPVTPGESYRAFISGACTDTTTQLVLGLTVYDQSMTHSTFVNGDLIVNGVTTAAAFTTAAVANTWVSDYGFTVVIPAHFGSLNQYTPYYAVPTVRIGSGSGTWYVTNWKTFEANAGLLLVDGSILANGTIIGSEFETTQTALRGIKVIGSVLTAYDNTGVATVNIDGSTGDVTLTGEFGTGPAGTAGVHISSTEFAGIYGLSTYPTIEWNNGATGTGRRQPAIFTDTTGNSNLYAWGGATSTTRMALMKLDSNRARLGIENTAGSNEADGARIDISNTGITIAAPGTIQFTDNAVANFQNIAAQRVDANGSIAAVGYLQAGTTVTAGTDVIATGMVQCDGTIATGATGGFQFTNVAVSSFRDIACGNVTVNGSGNTVTVANAPTTTSTANANISTTNGNLRLITSLSQFKLKQRPLTADDVRGILEVTPKTWFDKSEVEENGGKTKGLRRIPGVIAQEVEEHIPALAQYDAEGDLHGVAYDRMAAMLIPLIKEQQEQIAELTARIKVLEERG